MVKSARILLFLVLSAGAAFAGGVEILVPPAQISTARHDVHIVGVCDSPWVSLRLNGTDLPPVETDDSIFHALVRLPYGLNDLQLAPSQDGETGDWADAAVCEILCGPRIAREYEKLYQKYGFHERRGLETCLDCHGETDEDAEVEDAEWCYTCHSLVRDQFRSHVMNDRKLCTNCHRMKADLSWQRTGVYTDMNPCFLCHKDKIGEFAQDYIHGPVAGGTCTVCHSPHGSGFAANLRSPVPVLCLFCHTSVEERQEANVHEPFADGRCVACHDPHATGNRWVLNKQSGELCIECHHDDVTPERHRHPTDAKPRGEIIEELALDETGRLECLTCHTPHSSRSDFLLRSTAGHACLDCHPEYR